MRKFFTLNSRVKIGVCGIIIFTIASLIFTSNNKEISSSKIEPSSTEVKPTYSESYHFIDSVDIDISEIGLKIESDAGIGDTKIESFDKSTSIRGQSSIERIIKIQPEYDENLNASLTLLYNDSILNGHSEKDLILYSSTDNGKTWRGHLNSIVDSISNSIHLDGIEHFSLWTAGSKWLDEAKMMLVCGGAVGGIGDGDDFDGDGVCNDIDIDDDNDGILDIEEGYVPCTAVENRATISYAPFSYNPCGSNQDIQIQVWAYDHLTSLGGRCDGLWSQSLNFTWQNLIPGVPAKYEVSMHAVNTGNPVQMIGTINAPGFSQTVIGGGGVSSGTIPFFPNTFKYFTPSGTTASGSMSVSIGGNANSFGGDIYMYLDVPTQDITPVPGEAITIYDNTGTVVTILCGGQDSDNDGIEDHFDLDSDNDGCPDATETGFGIDVTVDSTMVGPYGDNGLVDAIESDDSDNATVILALEDNGSGTPIYLDATKLGFDCITELTAFEDEKSTAKNVLTTIDVQVNDRDPEDDPFTTSLLGASAQGITPMLLNDDSISYTPPTDFVGLDSFEYKICDASMDCDTGLVIINVLPDTDDDGIADVYDFDDDNDGIPDITELACGNGTAETTTYTTTVGSQLIEGTYTNGNATADYSIDLSDASAALTAANNYDGAGVHYIFNDASTNFTSISTISPQVNTLINTVEWGPDLNGNTDSENINIAQNIRLTWTPEVPATVIDPDGQLDLADGTIISSNQVIDQAATYTAAAKPTWKIIFETNLLTSDFVLTTRHASASNMGSEGYDLNANICYLENTDGDALANHLDLDSDGDGCYDLAEAGAGAVTDSLATGAVGSNGFADNLESPIDSDTINYTSSYYYALSSVTNVCADSDGDNIGDLIDIDDDNDGVLDVTELGCGEADATNTNVVLTLGSQLVEGVFKNGSDSASYSIDLSDAAVALVAAEVKDGRGVSWVFDDNTVSDFTQTITVSPAGDALLNKVFFGPNLTGTQHTAGDNAAQTITLTWSPTVTAIVHDPDNQLSEADGSTISSGNSFSQSAALTESTASWSIEFPLAIFPSDFTLTASHTGHSQEEGYSLITEVCGSLDTDMDGKPNSLDLDSDGDGCYDLAESGAGAVTDSLVTGTVGLNGFADNLETTADNAEISYTSSYFYALSSVTNVCADSDGDNIGDLIDIDDDNDGILDVTELGCGVADATNTNVVLTLGSQLVEGVFRNGSDSALYSIDLSDAAVALVAAEVKDGRGVSWVFDDNTVSDFTQTITVSPAGDALLNRVFFGPNITGTQHTAGDNAAQTITLIWAPTVTAIVHDPDNQLSVANGSTLTSGDSFSQSAALTEATAKWSIEFPLAIFPSDFTLTTSHTGHSQEEGYSLITEICGSLDTDMDGKPNSLDLDSDGDGCYDLAESGAGAVTDSLVTGTVGLNGFADNLETITDNAEISYTSTYYLALTNVLNACSDSDNDNVGDLIDLDDDNDGVLDVTELNCGNGEATTTTFTLPIGSQLIEGAYTNGNATADYSIDLSDASVALVAANNYQGNGLHYIFNDATTNFTATLTVSPQTNTLLNTIKWGPDLNSNTDSENINIAQNITLNWSPNVTAIVVDPDNQLDIADGTIISSGQTLIQAANYSAANKPTWSITFNTNLLVSDFVLITNHVSASNMGSEGYDLNADICYLNNTDGDALANHLDLDSDGDGCYDAYESGVTGATNNGSLTDSIMATTNAEVGLNGLANSVETTADSDTIAYISSYEPYATFDDFNACADTDGDGIGDLVDIDDDNDGLTDSEESPFCYLSEVFLESLIRTDYITVTSDLNFTAGRDSLFKMVNGDYTSTELQFIAGQTQTDKTLYAFDFGNVVKVDTIFIPTHGTTAHWAGSVKVQGSLDGTTWTDLSPANSTGSVIGPALAFASIARHSLPITMNNGFYRHYRIQGVSGSSLGGTSNIGKEAWFAISDYIPEYFEILGCTKNDDDGDGIINQYDLDSDGDGCSDKYEAGVTGVTNNGSSTDSLTIPNGQTTGVGANGYADTVETYTESGQSNFTSTYSDYARDRHTIVCSDWDNDGINDIVDIDDDNDGILDVLECGDIVEVQSLRLKSSGFTRSTPLGTTRQGWTLTFGNIDIYAPCDVNEDNGDGIDGGSFNFTLERTIPTIPGNKYEFLYNHTAHGLQPVSMGRVRAYDHLDSTRLLAENLHFDVMPRVADGCPFRTSLTFVAISDSTTIEVASISGLEGYPGNPLGWGSVFGTFRFKNVSCTTDTDNDGIPNHLDLDSDGDGCYDAFEASVTGATNNGSVTDSLAATSAAQVGANGFANTLESDDTEAAIPNYGSTYILYALADAINTCQDYDMDGVVDVNDLDDDNDGILDLEESPNCFAEKDSLQFGDLRGDVIAAITTEREIHSGLAENLVRVLTDGDIGEGVLALTTNGPPITGMEVLRIDFKTPLELSNIYIKYIGANSFFNVSEIKIQGSLDGVNWTDLSPDLSYTYNVFQPNPYDNSGTNTSQDYPITINAAPYNSYRLLGVSGPTRQNGSAAEIYFTLANFDRSKFPTSTCTDDIDNDGLANHLDLDSDGDGCSDLAEVGAGAVTDSLITGTVGLNGFADNLETITDNGEISYTSTYYLVATNVLNACLDSDNDSVGDLIDIDDDNDGVLDVTELNCGNAEATTTTFTMPIGTQLIEGAYTNGNATADYSIDLSDASVALAAANNYQGNGLHYIFNDATTNFTATLTVSPQVNTLLNNIKWGPDLNGNTDSENVNGAQNITLSWSPNVTATVVDPDNQLDVTDGAIINSGQTIIQAATYTAANKPSWSITFNTNLLVSDFVLTTNHVGTTTLSAEGYDLNADICYLENTDGDALANHLDLDSDGDGCYDLAESGAGAVSDSLVTGSVGLNGFANNLETSADSDEISYNSTYYFALSSVTNVCADSDGDNAGDLIDIDDDNDGIPDAIELGCGQAVATNTNVVLPVGTQLVEGIYKIGNDSATYSIDLSDAAAVLVVGEVSDGNGVNWVYDDNNVASFTQTMTITPHNGALLNRVLFGPNVTGDQHTAGDNAAQNIVLDWSPGVEAIVHDPDNRLNVSDGSTITSGSTITQSAALTDLTATWYIEFPLAIFPSAFTLTTTHDTDSQEEGYSMILEMCSSADTDNDGIPNSLDLDSDGDMCYDAYESGVTGATFDGSSTDSLAIPIGQTTAVGLNGYADALETSEDGIPTYNSTYTTIASSANLNLCADTDNDNIPDLVDIDDDNDGVLDADESPSCFYAADEWLSGNRSDIIVSTPLGMNATYMHPEELVDGDNGTAAASYAVNFLATTAAASAPTTIYEFQMPLPVELSEINLGYISTATAFNANTNIKLQGSFDGSSWTDLNGGFNYSTATTVGGATTVPGVSGTSNNLRFTVDQNADAYLHYRLYWTGGGSIRTNYYNNEVYFQVSSDYSASANPKVNCVSDTDDDGTFNHQDLDSDDDGCYDLAESGAGAVTDSLVTQSVSFTTVGSNGQADHLETSADSDEISYNSTYYFALSSVTNVCADSDGDNVGDLIDIDDDNDGIPDAIELGCGQAVATNTNVVLPVGTQLVEGIYKIGNDSATYSIDLSDAAAVLVVGEVSDGNGVNWVYDDNNVASFTQTMTITPHSGALLNKVLFGPNVTGNQHTAGDNAAQNIVLDWSPGVEAIVHDPDNRLNVSDGSTITSGSTITQSAALTDLTATWYIEFPLAIFPSAFTLSSTHDTDSQEEGYSMILEMCSSADTDNDGIPNSLDLDSDGDMCYDAYESGVTGATFDGSSTDSLAIPIGQTTGVGLNGYADALETSEDGMPTYNSTYTTIASSSNLNLCADSDNDNIPDLVDIDDDNDGVLDADESPSCFYSINDWLQGDRSDIKVSTPLGMNATYMHPEELVDGDNGTAAASYAVNFLATTAAASAPTTIYEFQMPLPVELSEINLGYINTATAFNANTNIKLQGSFDGQSWTDLNGGFNYSTATTIGGATTVPGVSGTNNNLKFTVNQNADAYLHYRLYWTGGGSIRTNYYNNEVYFQVPSDYSASANPKVDCASDTDGDGVFNYQDLDSDDDGCYDLAESGAGGVTDSLVTQNASFATVGNNGLADHLETSADSDSISYTSTYYFALSSVTNVCADSDGDDVGDLIDIDDDNDGIPDAIELGCGSAVATNTNVVLPVGTQLVEGTYKIGNDSATYSIDLSDAAVALVQSEISDGTGVNWVYDDNNLASFTQTMTITPHSGALLNKVLFGPNVTGDQHTAGDNAAQNIVLNWSPGVEAIVHDPDNRLNVSDGSTITSGSTITQSAALTDLTATWYIEFPLAIFPSAFTLSSTHDTDSQEEGYSMILEMCSSADTDGDGIPNSLDLDSDGDMCYDAYESGVTGATFDGSSTDSLAIPVGQTTGVGLNGYADALETSEDGMPTYNSTYTTIASSSNLNLCADSDNDNIPDLVDIDDDNDGVLDADESPSCFYAVGDWLRGYRGHVIVTSPLNMTAPYTHPQELVDGDNGKVAASYAVNLTAAAIATAPTPIYNFHMGLPVELSEINLGYVNANTNFNANTNIKLQGSFDGTTWTDLNSGFNYSTTTATGGATTVPGVSGINQNLKFTVDQNADAYLQYRLYWTGGGSIRAGYYTNEVYFQVPSDYSASANPKIGCVADKDGDGILNHLDLDSDGDGCYDLTESGAGPIGDSLVVQSDLFTAVGNNGLADHLETSAESDSIGYTLHPYHLDSMQSACLDTDLDGVGDLIDVDDDNDGVTDVVEGYSCATRIEGTPLDLGGADGSFNSIAGSADAFNSNVTGGGWFNGTGSADTWITPMPTTGSGVWGGLADGTPPSPADGGVFAAARVGESFYTTLSNLTIGQNYTVIFYQVNAGTDGTTIIGSFARFRVTFGNEEQFTEEMPYLGEGNQIWQLVQLTFTAQETTARLEFHGDGGSDDALGTDNIGIDFVQAFEGDGSDVLITECSSPDTDGDGIENHLDLDSDGDGCYDAYESAVTGATNNSVLSDSLVATTNAQVGLNGLANSIETNDTDTATVTYNSTYSTIALSTNLNLCADTDNDNIPDLVDIDDDNDGVLDADESPSCFYSINDWLQGDRSDVKVSTPLNMHTTYFHPEELVDGDNRTGSAGYAVAFLAHAVASAPTTIYEFKMPLPVELSEINLGYISTATAFNANTNIKLQGSFDGFSWTDLNGGFNYSTSTTVGGATTVPGVSGTNHNLRFTVNQNADAYLHYRLYWTGGGSIRTNYYNNEVYFQVPSDYSASANPKVDCDSDLDGDGVFNHLDLDSDGDGCYDLAESGAGAVGDSLVDQSVLYTSVGANGLADHLETSVDSDSINYSVQSYYLEDINNACADSDMDGVGDLIDIDDDNDGILDTEEWASCATAGTVNKSSLTVTSGLTWSGTLANMLDEAIANNLFASNGQNIANKEYLRFEMGDAVALDMIELQCVTQGLLSTGAQLRVEGSNDGSGWTDLSGTITTIGRTTGVLSASPFAENFVFDNNTAYQYYRLYGISGTTINWYLTEAHFNAVAAAVFCDTDGDGIPNQLDLDSDGDGCYDAYEAGMTGATNDGSSTDSLAIPAGQTTGVGLNGYADALETSEDGIPTYNSTYSTFASSANLNLCADSDNDNIPDLVDIDDDNDGILDAQESPSCFYLAQEWLSGDRSNITVSTPIPMHATYMHPEELVDGDNGTAAASYAVSFIAQSVANAPMTVYEFNMGLPVELSEINLGFISTATHFNANTNIKLQGSFNGSIWTDLNSGFNYATSTLTGGATTVPGVSGTKNNLRFIVDQNADAYLHYRLYWTGGGSIRASQYSNEVYFQVPSDYSASANPKVDCDSDLDGDGVFNHLDLDSDGDGCHDLAESGAGAVGDSLVDQSVLYTSVGANGLADHLETSVDSDSINYSVQSYYLEDINNACADSDMDGVGDLIDIDDDNDGILDTDEWASCATAGTVDKSSLTVTSGITWSGSLANMLDEAIANNLFASNGQNIANKEYLRFDMGDAVALDMIELQCVTQGLLSTGAQLRVEGSNDGSGWTDLSGTITTIGRTTGVLSASPFAENFVFDNNTAYQYYRLYGISGTTINWYLTEAHFNAVAAAVFCDTDGDGIPNNLDLDSDGDGCYDAYEAGVPGATSNATSTDSLVIPAGQTTGVGANGFFDALEDPAESGAINYTSNYSDALDASISLCPTCQGTTAPTMSGTALENTCPIQTIDLDSLHNGIIPIGKTLVWSTDSDQSDGISSTEPSIISSSGTYYAYYFDPPDNCYSPPGDPVTVTINICPDCAPQVGVISNIRN